MAKAKAKVLDLMGKGGPKVRVHILPLHFMLAVESLDRLKEGLGKNEEEGKESSDQTTGQAALWTQVQDPDGPVAKWSQVLSDEEQARCLVCLRRNNTADSWCWAVLLPTKEACQRSVTCPYFSQIFCSFSNVPAQPSGDFSLCSWVEGLRLLLSRVSSDAVDLAQDDIGTQTPMVAMLPDVNQPPPSSLDQLAETPGPGNAGEPLMARLIEEASEEPTSEIAVALTNNASLGNVAKGLGLSFATDTQVGLVVAGFTPGGRMIIWNALEGRKIGDRVQTGDKLRMACLYPPQKSPDQIRKNDCSGQALISHTDSLQFLATAKRAVELFGMPSLRAMSILQADFDHTLKEVYRISHLIETFCRKL